ncbi:glycerol-3-phosphate dehydrogenase [Cognatishimia sp.]|uniref:glycerol-3-phosphate dehydrogenase n=1 Tax=Cognatishimia sp. TaxID=2211648 RepID=UPI0035126D8D
MSDKIYDLFIIGGGINGCGIARDASGRGLSVALAEMNDLASATSSASTKLFHGGLRYLEYFEFRLVKEALEERETLLRAMPHISWPMRFVLPYHKDMRFDSTTPTSKLLTTVMPWMKGRRPAWLIRLGLFLYDNLGGRKILPATTTVDLTHAPEGAPIEARFAKAYEYSDCWVQDSRLVVLNARDAEARGANIMTRTKVTSARRVEDHWEITTEQHGRFKAKMLVNAGGPWVMDVIQGVAGINSSENIRLVRGSHIVTKRLYDHDKCYFFQGTDGRIIFAIPYEQDYTLIGTTDADHASFEETPTCSDEERDYLIQFANGYFKQKLTAEDVVWTYSGVRPLYNDGAANATAATREYVLRVNTDGGAPILNVFGGKITTYRRLAEAALDEVGKFFPDLAAKWTAGVPLAGGDFAPDGVADLSQQIATRYPFLEDKHVTRLLRTYGTEVFDIYGAATTAADLGEDFGAGITAAELDWAMRREWVVNADDFLWRRTKLGLRLSSEQRARIGAYLEAASG